MRALIAVLAATVVVGCLALVAVLGAAVTGGVGCPLALLEGELVAVTSTPQAEGAVSDTLGVQGPRADDPVMVTWPFGYRVERQDGALVLVHLWSVAGREGDWVAVGGGAADDGSFTACGPVSVGTAPPPAPPASPAVTPSPPAAVPATSVAPLTGETSVRLTGRVRSPCAMPPSGCGHWVTLVLPGGGTRRARIQVDLAGGAGDGTGRITGAGPELPASLPGGRFGLVFEAAEFSDAASPSTLPDGSVVYPPEQPAVACTAVLETWDESPAKTVRVVFDGFDCTVTITPDTAS